MTSRPPPPPADDDTHLWTVVTQSVAPLKGRKKPLAAKAAPTDSRKNAPVLKKPHTAAPPCPPARPATSSPSPRALSGLDRSTETRLRRGRLEIEAMLDLHGMTQTAAHNALIKFISGCSRKGHRTVLVITGKGTVSTGGGVLRRMLPLWLEATPLCTLVAAFSPAQARHGGTGAFYLRLRNIAKKK